MDVFESLTRSDAQIRTIGMHTAGEPTRIVIQGFPALEGRTLLEKRTDAKTRHDGLRTRLMHEPRGHRDMYGAILVQETELVQTGEAHIGVLFCHNEGYSTMCGHATLALGRFLVDTHDTTVFPSRTLMSVEGGLPPRINLKLHAPCGLVKVSVPVLPPDSPSEQVIKSDPSRPVWFLSVPSYAVATNVVLHIPRDYCWPELLASGTEEIKLDLAFGGAFYGIISVQALGFSGGYSLDVGLANGSYSISALDRATRLLKAYIIDTPELNALLRHPTSPELEYLYGITVIDPPLDILSLAHSSSLSTVNSDVGICFFADQQIDRSPTGSCVCARVALALAKGERELDVPWVYHSVLTKRKGEGAFAGRAVERVLLDQGREVDGKQEKLEAWVVKVEGQAYYTDAATFVLEKEDSISKEGFTL